MKSDSSHHQNKLVSCEDNIEGSHFRWAVELEVVSIREGFWINTPLSLVLLAVVDDAFYDGFIDPLGLPIGLVVVSSLER